MDATSPYCIRWVNRRGQRRTSWPKYSDMMKFLEKRDQIRATTATTEEGEQREEQLTGGREYVDTQRVSNKAVIDQAKQKSTSIEKDDKVEIEPGRKDGQDGQVGQVGQVEQVGQVGQDGQGKEKMAEGGEEGFEGRENDNGNGFTPKVDHETPNSHEKRKSDVDDTVDEGKMDPHKKSN